MGSIQRHDRGRVAVLEIHNPAKLNAWDRAMQRDLAAGIRECDAADDVDAIVIAGAGSAAFCAGQDLAESKTFSASDVGPWLDGLMDLYAAPLRARKPVVAAVRGVAAGSGYQFTLMCDLRVTHETARIGQPEVKNGIPSITGHFLTERALGHTRAADLMLTGRLLDGEEAFRIGIAQLLVEEERVLDEAVALAAELATRPALAFQLTKRNIHDSLWPGLERAFAIARSADEEAWGDGEPAAAAERFLRG